PVDNDVPQHVAPGIIKKQDVLLRPGDRSAKSEIRHQADNCTDERRRHGRIKTNSPPKTFHRLPSCAIAPEFRLKKANVLQTGTPEDLLSRTPDRLADQAGRSSVD